MPTDADDPYRLPTTARPLHYRLRLEPDLTAATFTGGVEIDLDVSEPAERLLANAIDLDVSEAWLVDAAGARHALAIATDPDLERISFTAPNPVSGPVTLGARFTGTLNDLLRGFYRSTFTDPQGASRTIATSQLQATDARRVFPCWDEPAFKATFEVTLVVADGLLAVSNGPEVSRRPLEDGRLEIRFAPTMVMSTYLVAFIVGPLEVTEPRVTRGVPIRVVHVPGKAHLTDFALDCAAAAIETFEDYYGIAYPAAKLDLAALPDFAMGAMENLGCVTFRENLLLVDRASATTDEQRLVADVICHEIAHMWFGDLVTMRWWNGIWLNEAFATFMEVMACDVWRPDWHRWEHFSLERGSAFDVDALASSRPIEVEVRSPEDASAMFDVLTYEKGGALLRMTEQYLGADRFRDGIRHYLNEHSYQNTETGDLWDAIEHVTGEPIRRILDSWIFQPGHPLVAARLEGSSVVLTQQRFNYQPESDDGARWAVPVQVRQIDGRGSHDQRVLLDGDRAELPLVSPEAAVVVNAGGHGFYRTYLDPDLRARLTGDRLAALVPLERYGLVDDTWAAVVAGRASVTEFLGLARGFGDETELSVWQVILAGLGTCDRFADETTRDGLAGYVRALCAPALGRLGLSARPGEPELDRQLRGVLLRAVAVLGADTTHDEMARQLLADRGAEPALVAAATSIVAHRGSDADHARFIERSMSAVTPQEQLRFMYALAEFPTMDQMTATLELVTSGQIRTQNAPFLLARAMGHRELGAEVWAYVRTRWDALVAAFPPSTVIRMLEGVKNLDDPAMQADVRAFFAERPLNGESVRVAQILERQDVNVGLHARTATELAELFGP